MIKSVNVDFRLLTALPRLLFCIIYIISEKNRRYRGDVRESIFAETRSQEVTIKSADKYIFLINVSQEILGC